MSLLDYMACMDSPDPATALDQVEPDFHFVLALPDRQVSGTSREEFATYIAGRNPSDRRHNTVRHARDGDLEFVYGIVTEQGHPTGAYLSSAVISPAGRLRRYLSFFDPTFRLLELPDPASTRSETP